MKKINFLVLFSAVLLSFACIQCTGSDDNPDDPNAPGSRVNNLNPGQITIRAKPVSGDKISFIAAFQKITIDWGDGSTDEFTNSGAVVTTLEHEYENQNVQEITVNTEMLTSLDFKSHRSQTNCIELMIGVCPDLISLDCFSSGLTYLDVSKCAALIYLYCNNNKLTSLDVSECTALEGLDCYSNQLTNLNVSGCNALKLLNCDFNALTSLDVSECTALKELWCINNVLTATALNNLFNTLPTYPSHSDTGSINIKNNSGTSTCNRDIAESKGWKVVY
jgi:Leucine-rich repeat (LRR) protein